MIRWREGVGLLRPLAVTVTSDLMSVIVRCGGLWAQATATIMIQQNTAERERRRGKDDEVPKEGEKANERRF